MTQRKMMDAKAKVIEPFRVEIKARRVAANKKGRTQPGFDLRFTGREGGVTIRCPRYWRDHLQYKLAL